MGLCLPQEKVYSVFFLNCMVTESSISNSTHLAANTGYAAIQQPYPRNKASANVSWKSVAECEYVNTGVSAHWRVCVWVCVLVSL